MIAQTMVDGDDVRACVIAALRNSPVGASTRFTLVEDVLGRYPTLDRVAAGRMVEHALALLQAEGVVTLPGPESWDRSGDERVRLACHGCRPMPQSGQ